MKHRINYNAEKYKKEKEDNSTKKNTDNEIAI